MTAEPGAAEQRRTDMRTRLAAMAAVFAFAVAVIGIAVVAAGSDDSGLERLPFASARSSERDAAAMSLGAPVGGAVEYVVEGTLPDLPGEAPGYRLGNDGAGPAPARVARALGVDVRRVSVAPAPGLPWYLSGEVTASGVTTASATRSVTAPAAVTACPPCAADADCATCGEAKPPHPLPPPPPVADLPSRDEAERLARDIFAKLGVDSTGMRLDGGTYSWEATVAPTVGGLPTIGLEHGLSIGPKGELTGGHGYLGEPDRIGDYPLAGVQKGLDRLRNGVGVDIGPRTLTARDSAEPFAVDKQVVTVTGVHLTLLHVEDALVPAYVFETKQGGTLPVAAVTDRWLDEHSPKLDPPGRIDVDQGSGSCSASASGVGVLSGEPDKEPADQPLTVQVCMEPAVAKVGQEVVFMVTATDPDAEIITGSCGGPDYEFGDEVNAAHTTCSPMCTAPLKQGTPGKYATTYRHAYAKAGEYTAWFSFRSGPCTTGSSEGRSSVTVVVK